MARTGSAPEIKSIYCVKDDEYLFIEKREDGFYLRNPYTEIPNEFSEKTDQEKLRETFEFLCKTIEEADEVFEEDSKTSGTDHKTVRDKYAKVIWDDGTEHWYRGEKLSTPFFMELCKSDFDRYLLMHHSEEWRQLITLKNVRSICESRMLEYEVLIKAIKRAWTDDYEWVEIKENADGTTAVEYYCYAALH